MLSPETPQDKLAMALEVADLGLKVHPLIEKRPLLDDWPDRATTDHRQIEEWLSDGSRNYGIVCEDIAVIDTDTEELSQWWIDNMPKTPWRVLTPRGGRHFYYTSVPNLRNAVKAHRGWDVRAGGRGYVVGAGSVVEGKRYELLGEVTLVLPPFDPAWLPPFSSEPLLLPNIALRPRGRIRNLRAYIRKIVSIQGERGSDACFRVACVLRDEGKTPDEAMEYMLEWNETSAIPPWSVRELEKKIRDAYVKAMKGG
jgi:hypothetical protein